jgi:hypothetical protein
MNLHVRRLRIMSCYFHMLDRAALRQIFHWKNSNGVIVALWGAVVAMAALGASLDNAPELFEWAYSFAVCAFVWSLGSWLTSDALQRRSRPPSRKQRRRLSTHSQKGYLVWKFGVSGLIATVFIGSLWLVADVKLRKELQSLKGRLLPASDPTPPNVCGAIPKEAALVQYGDNFAVAKKFPHHVIVFIVGPDDNAEIIPALTLDRSADGSIVVLMDVKTRDNKIVVRLDEHGFLVSESNKLKMERPDTHTLIVVDPEGEEVLNARYMNPQLIRLNGVLRYPRHRVPIQDETIHHTCVVDADAPGSADRGIRLVDR